MDTKKPKPKNNIVTLGWGNPSWFVLETFALGFPLEKPTLEQRKNYKSFFTSFKDVLPCNLCRDSYVQFLKKIPLTSKVMSGRKNLLFWVFAMHNRVNKKLGCKQYTRKQMEKKYAYLEKNFRAQGCSKNKGGCKKSASKLKRKAIVKIFNT